VNPPKGRDLVEDAHFGGATGQEKEALSPDAVINGHTDDAVAGEPAAVI
jgi:hypothetical protein